MEIDQSSWQFPPCFTVALKINKRLVLKVDGNQQLTPYSADLPLDINYMCQHNGGKLALFSTNSTMPQFCIGYGGHLGLRVNPTAATA